MAQTPADFEPESALAVSLYLDDASEPFARYQPPATVHLDTRSLADGNHALHIRARDAVGNVGKRDALLKQRIPSRRANRDDDAQTFFDAIQDFAHRIDVILALA